MAGTLSRVLGITAILATAGFALTACGSSTPTPEDTSTASATASSAAPTPSETASSTPTSTPTPTENPVDKGTPIKLGCNDLISAQDMYDYNPNFSLTDDYSPASGSDAATIVNDYQGVACRWVNDSSGEKLDIAVASLQDYTLTDLKNGLVSTSTSVPTYDVEGYFTTVKKIGQADAFSDPYWISADSDYFLEPGDASPLIANVIAALG
jgi:hypothetical protein